MSLLTGYEDIFVNPLADAAEEAMDNDETDMEVAMEAAAGKQDVELTEDDIDFILGYRDSDNNLDSDPDYEDDLTEGEEGCLAMGIATEALFGKKKGYSDAEAVVILKDFIKAFDGKYGKYDRDKKKVQGLLTEKGAGKHEARKMVNVSGVPCILTHDKDGNVKYAMWYFIPNDDRGGVVKAGQSYKDIMSIKNAEKSLAKIKKQAATESYAEESALMNDIDQIALEAEIAALEAELLSGSMSEPQTDGNPVEPDDEIHSDAEDANPEEEDEECEDCDGLEAAINDIYKSLGEN